MRIRLIAIDIDGTLLDSHFQLPAVNREAIVVAVEAGIEVALVTGRRFDFAFPIAEQIPCALTMIVNNGALIKRKDGATHLRHLLPRDIARRVLEATQRFRNGTAVIFDRRQQGQVVMEYMDWDDASRRGYFERNLPFLAQVSPLESCLTEDPIQVMFSGPVEPMREVAAVLRALDIAERYALAVTEYAARNFSLVDVIAAGVSKGAALAEWTRVQGLARENVMAIGDNLNDREMLEFAGLPVVMSNSVPELRELGWHTTLSNDQGGVAVAIRSHALGSS